MLTPTFAEPLSYLINQQLPPASDRQTLLFTATITEPVLALSEKTPPPGKKKAVVHLCGPSRCVTNVVFLTLLLQLTISDPILSQPSLGLTFLLHSNNFTRSFRPKSKTSIFIIFYWMFASWLDLHHLLSDQRHRNRRGWNILTRPNDWLMRMMNWTPFHSYLKPSSLSPSHELQSNYTLSSTRRIYPIPSNRGRCTPTLARWSG